MNRQLLVPIAAILFILCRDLLNMTDLDEASVQNAVYVVFDIAAAIGIFLHPKKVDKPPEPPVE